MYDMHWYNKQWAPLAAFLILGIAGVTGFNISQNSTDNTLYQNSLQACERGNGLREQTNDRLVVIGVQKAVLTKFVRSAYVARRDSAKTAAPGDTVDRDAAKAYASYLKTLSNVPTLESVDIVDCNTAIKKP